MIPMSPVSRPRREPGSHTGFPQIAPNILFETATVNQHDFLSRLHGKLSFTASFSSYCASRCAHREHCSCSKRPSVDEEKRKRKRCGKGGGDGGVRGRRMRRASTTLHIQSSNTFSGVRLELERARSARDGSSIYIYTFSLVQQSLD